MSNDVKSPPIIGAATRLIVSAPAPVPHMIGSSPQNAVPTVITLGRTRFTAPWMTASLRSFKLRILPLAAHSRRARSR